VLGHAAGESSPQAGSRSDSIYECLPLTCPKCGQPMRLIAFIMEPVVVEKIWDCEAIQFDQVAQANEWPDMDQSAGAPNETWN
jgi:hypothetical protein